MTSLLRACSLLALFFTVAQAHALGLGEARVRSDLSSPLLIEIPIVDLAASGIVAEEIRVVVPGLAEHGALGAREPILPLAARVQVVVGDDGAAQVRITTERASREPVLRFLLRATWRGATAVRAYELIVDPPGVAMPRPRLAAPQVVRATTAPRAATRARLLPPPGGPRSPAQAGTRYGPVRSGDTLYAIIAEAYPALAASPGGAARAIVARNPQAFIGGDPARVLMGATLELPGAGAIATAASEPAATAARATARAATAAAVRPAAPQRPASTVSAATAGGAAYTVKPGDTLYGIVRTLTGAGGQALAAAVDRVHAANPQAFIEGDRDRLRVGARLAIDAVPATVASVPAAAAPAAEEAPAAAPAAEEAMAAEAVASVQAELAALEEVVAEQRAEEADLAARLDRLLAEAARLRDRESRLTSETDVVRERLVALAPGTAARTQGADAPGVGLAGGATPEAAAPVSGFGSEAAGLAAAAPVSGFGSEAAGLAAAAPVSGFGSEAAGLAAAAPVSGFGSEAAGLAAAAPATGFTSQAAPDAAAATSVTGAALEVAAPETAAAAPTAESAPAAVAPMVAAASSAPARPSPGRAAPPAPAPEEGMVDQVLGTVSGLAGASGSWIAGAGAALAGLLALLMLRRRRAASELAVPADPVAEANAEAAKRRLAELREKHDGASSGDFTDEALGVAGKVERKVVMTGAAEANKLAKEAAVHMAYGNMEESKACILEAIRLDPGRDEHKMMLITVYESTNEHGKARAIVDDLLKRREELPQELRARLESAKAG